jgi:hypothetical protein
LNISTGMTANPLQAEVTCLALTLAMLDACGTQVRRDEAVAARAAHFVREVVVAVSYPLELVL